MMQQKKYSVEYKDFNLPDHNDIEENFLFGITLHLGHASNNYAEYTGIILAQLYGALFGLREITIMSDSLVAVKQIKGQMKTKNIRLVELIKISHALSFKYQYVYLNWIERDKNQLADKFARIASQPRF